MSMHSSNCFLTLTYDEEHLPGKLICKNTFAKFIKRLRKHAKKKIRYMVSHEYGSRTLRPHHHLIVFGWEPRDLQFLKKSKSGYPLFTSRELSKLWKLGHHSIGEANEKTAYYLAAYALKNQKTEVLSTDGELTSFHDTFNCSTNPGIGKLYFEKNYKQLIDSGEILPRYYSKLLQKLDPHWACIYEEKQMQKFKDVGPSQMYAKYEIEKQNQQRSDGEFRSAPGLTQRDHYQRSYLKERARRQHDYENNNSL